MTIDLDLAKRLAGLSPEARLRVENALQEALAKEVAVAAAGFDRGPFDRSGFDRSASELTDLEGVFVEKNANPARST
jgi:hypothetical protein